MDAHRKIELHSLADLTYLQDSARRVAEERVTQSGNDALKEPIHAYLDAVYATVRQNMTINQMEEPQITACLASQTETEPFDHKLAAHVQRLTSEIERLTTEIALKRRTRPALVAEAYDAAAATANARAKHDTTATTAADQNAATDATQEPSSPGAFPSRDQSGHAKAGAETHSDNGPLQLSIPRPDEMKATYEAGLGDLMACKRQVKATVEKLERAREVLALT